MSCECCKREIEIKARNLCGACYQRWRKTGSTEYQRKGKTTTCHVKDCGKRAISHGLCDKHRKRLERHNHIENTRPEYWGSKEKHPMYYAWCNIKKHAFKDDVSQIWLDDFFQFVLDVGERPSKKHKLFRADDSKQYGPDNFVWKESFIQYVDGEDKKTYLARRAKVDRAIRKEAHHDIELKRNFGLSNNQYIDMLNSQGGKCAICDKPEIAKDRGGTLRRLAVDHCHDTGKVRGLLCTKCNMILGGVNDSPAILKEAIRYLDKFSN